MSRPVLIFDLNESKHCFLLLVYMNLCTIRIWTLWNITLYVCKCVYNMYRKKMNYLEAQYWLHCNKFVMLKISGFFFKFFDVLIWYLESKRYTHIFHKFLSTFKNVPVFSEWNLHYPIKTRWPKKSLGGGGVLKFTWSLCIKLQLRWLI